MAQKKILILGAGNAQRDAIELLNAKGYETHACAMDDTGNGVASAQHFALINIVDVEKVKQYVMENDIDIVYSVGSDIAMPVVSKVSEELNLPHFISETTARDCNAKDKMRSRLGPEFEGNAVFQVIESVEEVPGLAYPYIMKPADAQGQRGVHLIHSEEEFRERFPGVKKYSRAGKVIAEQYIDGPEISVNVYVVDGDIKFFLPSDRITWPEYTGLIHKHQVPSEVVTEETNKKMYTIVENALHKMEIYNGPAYFQMMMEDNEPYIIEMTPRLDGCHMWELIEHYTGINLLTLTLDHLLNNDVSELNRHEENNNTYQLEFFCQKPGTVMDKEKFTVPDGALTNVYYCETGEEVPEQNGRFEKVGYFIQNVGENRS